MKVFKTIFLVLSIALFAVQSVNAQFMPVVYDNTYGKTLELSSVCADFQNGDIVTVGVDGSSVLVSWINRVGDVRFSKQFPVNELSTVNKIIPCGDDKVILVGARKVGEKEKNIKAGRVLILNIKGEIERNISLGEQGTMVANAEFLPNGNLIVSGSTVKSSGAQTGFISKLSPTNKEIYSYTPAVGGNCDEFNILGSQTEFINVAFSSVKSGGSSIVRLDDGGRPFFITTLPDPTFKVEQMISNIEGDVYLVGQGEQVGGVVVKIRPEGDIVFHKQIIPASAETKFNKLVLGKTGELMVGGNDGNTAYFYLLRSDGTELSAYKEAGRIAGLVNNPNTGDCYVSVYNPGIKQGRMVKFSAQGQRLFERLTAAEYTSLYLNFNGDVLMAAPGTGRLSMLSNFGELLFDRFVVENTPQQFADAMMAVNGEVFFFDDNNRVAKLAHGLYVSDITVSKPIDGYSTAVFTVTLSGYSYTKEGSPIPVRVNYNTAPINATAGLNYENVSGSISFVPPSDGSERYLNKAIIEVPVLANDFLEGNRTFALNLSDVKDSYLIKAHSTATIQDQPAIVKMISTTAGLECEKDVLFELGIFKTNGTKLTNATKSDIVIEGLYGNGSADRLDFDMGRSPKLIISSGKHSGLFNVVTLEDARYESIKTVVVNFNRISAMSDTNVSFGSNSLLCAGQIFDQPAYVTIESLGDFTKLNNVVSGLYKITLVRAKDDMPLVNHSGADAIVSVRINEDSTAKLGTDFIFSNAHDLRIWGDDKSSAVNLNGMVLYTPEKGVKSVSVSIDNVVGGSDAAKLEIHPTKNAAQFKIINE